MSGSRKLALVVLAFTLPLTACTEPGSSGQTGPEGHPLDPYPGFGRSPWAALRDDAIAVWEAFRREELASECMRRKGFEYRPQVDIAGFQVRDAARYLGTELPDAPPVDAARANQEYRNSLGPERLDAYYRSLYGERLKEVRAFFESDHGEVPPGNNPATFLRRGCTGRAEERIPIVWEANRRLGGDLERLGRGELTASSFIAQNRRVLDEQRDRYRNAKAEMLSDPSFIAWLAGTLRSDVGAA